MCGGSEWVSTRLHIAFARSDMTMLYRTMPQVMVISSEGYFYSYNIDLENGGECSLMKQYRYLPLPYPIRHISNVCSFLVCLIPVMIPQGWQSSIV